MLTFSSMMRTHTEPYESTFNAGLSFGRALDRDVSCLIAVVTTSAAEAVTVGRLRTVSWNVVGLSASEINRISVIIQLHEIYSQKHTIAIFVPGSKCKIWLRKCMCWRLQCKNTTMLMYKEFTMSIIIIKNENMNGLKMNDVRDWMHWTSLGNLLKRTWMYVIEYQSISIIRSLMTGRDLRDNSSRNG